MSNRIIDICKNVSVISTDKYSYGYDSMYGIVDFLHDEKPSDDIDAIVTNPPYKFALEFCEKAVKNTKKVAMFLKLTFLEGAKRHAFFEKHPPKYVAVCVNRLQCALNGDPEEFKKSSAACYAWFIWEKDYTGMPKVMWLTKKGRKG